MQFKRLCAGSWFLFFVMILPFALHAQVNSVQFGKNRVQFKKFKWKFYQSPNFNVYFNQDGLELAKYVTQVAEEDLKGIEKDVEYNLQRRANIIVYNSYDDYKASNIGLGQDWQNAGGTTKLVNNKVVVYFDGNHNNLHLKVREGIAKALTDNILFGDDVGEFASNAALLDLPQWLTDGYIQYIAEHWSTAKDDKLKSAMLSGDYKNFYQFAFDRPEIAGNAFWYYIAEKYKPENVTYFLYLARLYKNLNTASTRICKKKFKEVLADFMDFEMQKYENDLKQRRNAPKGRLSIVEETTKSVDYYNFAANPNPRSNSYAVVKFKKGIYSVKFVDNYYDEKVLLKYGVNTLGADIAPNYPILSWDGKGSRLLVIYTKEGAINMFVYDAVGGSKRFEQPIVGFDQITDAGFMLDANTLLISAVKNGHSDIFTYKIDNGKIKAITNDVYDDLDPTFASFPNRTAIIFASNRPGVNASVADTAIPSRNHFNIYMVDLLNTGDTKQITQLTNVKYGNARYPMQYNANHFTYVNDENGIANRWAGFFSTKRDGLDTLYYIGDEILRNPGDKEIDSTLAAWQKQEPDSISYFQVYKDSTFTFPITNYQSGLLETRQSGYNGQVSEVRREGDEKFLYNLKVDSVTLRKRNVTARPTDYIKGFIQKERLASGKTVQVKKDSAAVKPRNDIFQNEFDDDKPDTSKAKSKVGNNTFAATAPIKPQSNEAVSALTKSKLYDYRLKFNVDNVTAGITNNILINRFQPYAGGSGPIELNDGNDINFSFEAGASDILEDIKFMGGIRLGTNLSDKDVFISFQDYKKRLDWGFTYYRSNQTNYSGLFSGYYSTYDNMLITNLYQLNLSLPINEIKSIRATIGIRSDKAVLRAFDGFPDLSTLGIKDSSRYTAVSHIEYVHDNSINPVQNIWNGLRFKIYTDIDFPLNTGTNAVTGAVLDTKPIFNVGYDVRYYYKIYRNFIWAGRAAGDFSWGDSKIIYYLGGADGWIGPKFNNANQVLATQNYAFQSLELNMRGYDQNLAHGNNAMVINSEFRLPVFTTFFNKPINNAFVRNFQVIQFIDLGTAWEGAISNIGRPTSIYSDPNLPPVTVKIRAGGIGPFAGGYGFGVRSTLLGYFLKLDAGWPMNGFFSGSPILYFALGFDF